MTTPANLTYSDIQTRVANALRIPTTNTTEMAKIAGVINAVYRDIAAKQDWWWLLKRSVINTAAKVTDGTLNLTAASTSFTFSVAPQRNAVNVSVALNRVVIPGQANDTLAVYMVTSSHTAGLTAAQFDAAYTDVTSTAAAYRLYQDAYDLPTDCGKVMNVMRYGEVLPLRRVGIEEMSQWKLFDQTEGRPEAYSVYDFNVTGDPTSARRIQFHPYPDKMYRLEVWYKQNLNTELASTTQPFIPDDYREVLYYGALARGYPVFLNDLERGKYFQTLFNDLMALMAAQQREYTRDQAGVAPDDTYRRGRRPRRSGQVTLGGWFDRIPYQP